MSDALAVSITEVVAFTCQTGDIAALHQRGPSAKEGIQAHQTVQKKRGKNYQSEVAIEAHWQVGEQTLLLRGRIDGVLFKSADDHASCELEEIKSMYGKLEDQAESSRALHLAQLKFYAWMWMSKYQLSEISAQLTHYDINARKEYNQSFQFELETLKEFVDEKLNQYWQWYSRVLEHRKQLQKNCQSLTFPFSEFRTGQREMSVTIYHHIREQKNCMIEAPTGIGKTVSALFPSFKAVGESLVEQVIFLTAKTSGRLAAFDGIQLIRQQGIKAKALVLQAKEKACFCSKDKAFIVEGQCCFQQGFYDRLPEALVDCFQADNLNEEALSAIAKQYQLCPFELSLKLVEWVDLVIADYNYVFDPVSGLNNLTGDKSKKVFLIDEAHNLIDRSKDMYSAELSQASVESLAETKSVSVSLRQTAAKIARLLDGIDDESSVEQLSEEDEALLVALCRQHVSQIAHAATKKPLTDEVVKWLKLLVRYLVIDELAGEHHQYFVEQNVSGLLEQKTLRRRCLNASEYIAQHLANHSHAMFSGTLGPDRFFRQSLGIDDETARVNLPSPFSTQQSCVLIARHIDTRYRQRPFSVGAIVDCILEVKQAKLGKYLVCFPSYVFMQQVYELFVEKHGDKDLWLQERDANDQSKAEFIRSLSEAEQGIGFVIMGGSYTEGIDFKGDALHGVLIVGTGLPQIEPIRDAIKMDFEQQGFNGFDMAYRFPGLQRVLQTAGRVIRTEEDRGLILLLDQRFMSADYRRYFPSQWQPQLFSEAMQLRQHLEHFWQQN
ncbi:ATP-dependent DNA helicase [Pleionea sp. CnH1-48]|uniref:ATP-dependent DNA helicase n=1 Tax=Pleionea sp. CnH1-48 TaxID=2954494 RepID=UPI002096B04E|nr:ATP-dependent DNA helicase [Pleionea sp. CnH1-48]MCO7225806.1 ATP-dependent DNA helicase [Pleionea sp. CnH1-48]